MTDRLKVYTAVYTAVGGVGLTVLWRHCLDLHLDTLLAVTTQFLFIFSFSFLQEALAYLIKRCFFYCFISFSDFYQIIISSHSTRSFIYTNKNKRSNTKKKVNN